MSEESSRNVYKIVSAIHILFIFGQIVHKVFLFGQVVKSTIQYSPIN